MASESSGLWYERWWILEHKGRTYYVRAWDMGEALDLFNEWIAAPIEVDWLMIEPPTEMEEKDGNTA